MLLSMTGFCSTMIELPVKQGESLNLSLEIKTFNSRFFEGSCRLPGSLNYLEHKILSLLKKELIRGRAYCNLKVVGESNTFERVVPVLSVAQDYLDGANRIKENSGLQGDISISDIVDLQGVFSFERGDVTQEQEDMLMRELAQAINRLNETRRQEGEHLQADLVAIFGRCAENMKKISVQSKVCLEKKKKDVGELAARAESGDQQASVLLEEAYKILDKIDIHEEISRFESHLQTVTKVLESEKRDKGRRLDFICQELMRETNTTTAKCSDFLISSAAVDIKVDLEKAREQVQNVA